MHRNDVLTVDVVAEPDGLWVRLDGELDLSTAEMLEASVPAWPRGGGAVPVVLDLRGVTFCDGAGLRAVVRARRTAHALGVICHVIVSRPVQRVAETAGLETLLHAEA